MIDFRSDTVTIPSTEMLEAMMKAKVGDDVFNEDPAIKELEEYMAGLMGCEMGIFCPSGTMTNQIGIKVLSSPYEEVICYEGSHIYKYEGGGVAGTSGLSFRLLQGERGKISAEEITENINKDDIHLPKTRIVELENTVNKAGGSCYKLEEIKKIYEVVKENGLNFHLDGARLFNAIVATKDNPKDYGKYFDTISICLSKGLGAPVGSVLVGKSKYIVAAKRVRKYFGGGMRQAGYLAAAGLFAIKNNVKKLEKDHQNAKIISSCLKNCDFVESILPVETNIIIFKVKKDINPNNIVERLNKNDIKTIQFSKNEIRLVTHMDISEKSIYQACEVFKNLSFTDQIDTQNNHT